MNISVLWFFLKLAPSSNLTRYSNTELFIHFCIPVFVWQKHFKVPLSVGSVQYSIYMPVSIFFNC